MENFLLEYGYSLKMIKHDTLCLEDIRKIRLYSTNGAIFLLAYEIDNEDVNNISSIYEKAKQVDADIFVFFTPKDEKKLLQQVLDNETVCLPQFGDDLGERMKNAIGIVLRMGYEKVILIGTDIPQIHPETLKNAFDNLGGKDIVIHPTFDGGYYLIGMKKEYDSIWKIERYGTNTVIYDTLQHMRNEKLSTAVGQMYYDVDDKGDLYHLYEDIEKGAICNCPITIDYLELGLKGKLDKNYE